MRLNHRHFLDFVLLAGGLSATSAGLLLDVSYLVAGGAIVLLVSLLRGARWMVRQKRRRAPACVSVAETVPTRRAAPAIGGPADQQTEVLVEELLAQGRFTLLLRPQIAKILSVEQRARATGQLEEHMALVPGGDVSVGPAHGDAGGDFLGDRKFNREVTVEPLYLDRYPVTNRVYQEFVDAGGYEQMSLWETDIWPAVLEFTDQTGRPAPRYWEHGRFRAGEEDFPVIGVSWFEASAFARWAGKRLPSDPEWIKAGSWPVSLGDGRTTQRRFPWGDSIDRKCANLWGSGPGEVVSVREFAEGVSVGGVYQLIGNVWEWTSSQFGVWDAATRELECDVALRSLRGGAFNTYFENQATCQFQSGENPLARRDNIGFRCAISLCDLVPYLEADSEAPLEAAAIDDEPCAPEPVLVGAADEAL